MKHLKYMRLVILGLLFITLLPGFTQEQPDLNIVYPKNNANINAPSTFFVGSTSPKAKLTIDESPVAVYPNGSFVHVTDLKRGSNNIIIRSTLDNKEKTATYTINVPEYEKTIPNSPLKIDKTSIKPDQDMLLKPGDIINIKFKGSTGNNASFSIGSKKDIPMIELPPSYSKTPVVFGKAFETSQYPLKGIYNGVYTIRDSDNFQNEPVIIKLGSDNKNITEITGARISTISNNTPIVAEVIKDKAIVRTSPDKSRLTPLPKDTILNITGKIGSNYRFQMGKAMEGWIESKDVRLLPEGTPLAQSSVSSIKVESLPDSVLIKVPLSQKLPFNIEEVVNNQLSLSVYGGLADVNILSYNNDDLFIKEIKWTQSIKDTFKILITPNTRQFWGYNYYYEDNTLVLKLKKPPVININKPFQNITIAIDPGHGGSESGSVGPTGIPEKTVNLAISKHLKEKLESNGAKVIMTRQTDNENVGLYERIETADKNNAQILLSIHNNALPDGRDPYKEHGSSTYYYHSQSLPLTKSIQKALVQNLGFKDYGIFWNSLALTRPTQFPAVLVEIGFMINPDEYALLIDKDFQEKAADSIYQGLENFLKDSLSNYQE